MDKQEFTEKVNEIMQIGLNINVIEGMAEAQLINLIIEPEKHIKDRLITSKELIDRKRQIRELECLKETVSYKQLISIISKLKKDSRWLNIIDTIQIGRKSGEKPKCTLLI